MRILVWMVNFWPIVGGIEVRATQLLPALKRRGYEFLVVASQGDPDLPQKDNFQGIPVHRFPFWNGYHDINELMAIRKQITRIKRSFAPDLVHQNGVGIADFYYLITENVNPAPLLVTLCDDLRCQSLDQDTALSHILHTADWISSVSAAALAQVRQLVPEVRERSSFIPNGLDISPYSPTPLPTEAPRLLCLGRLAHQKGFDLALRAFASVVQHFPHARLILAGDGPERSVLEQQTDQLGLTKSVDFLGWVLPEKVPSLINTAMLVVMPSRWEGFPTVALQAALMARPVVATRVGGLPEIVEHQRTGLLIEKENSTALAEAMKFLLNHIPTASQMGQAARSRVQEMFDWESYVDAYDHLYRELINSWREKKPSPTS